MYRYTKIALLSAAISCTTVTTATADGVSDQLADGQPWNATAPNGRTMQMTLNPDGTGQMKAGIIRRSISWRAVDGDLCLNGLPTGGERCMTLEAQGNGFIGQGPDGGAMVLSR